MPIAIATIYKMNGMNTEYGAIFQILTIYTTLTDVCRKM